MCKAIQNGLSYNQFESAFRDHIRRESNKLHFGENRICHNVYLDVFTADPTSRRLTFVASNIRVIRVIESTSESESNRELELGNLISLPHFGSNSLLKVM